MTSTYLQSMRGIGRDARLCLFSWALLGFGAFGGIFTVLGNLYLLRLGYGPEGVGLFNSAGLFAYSACALPAAVAGRSWGSRRPMIVGLSMSTLGFLLLPLAESAPSGWEFAWLMATFALANSGISLFWINSKPFLSAVSGPNERDHVFSAWMAVLLLSGFVGSMVSGFLPGLISLTVPTLESEASAYRFPLWITALCMGIATLSMASTRRMSGGPAEETRRLEVADSGVAKIILLLALSSFFRPAAEAVARTFFNVYLDAGLNTPTELIGVLASLGQLVAVPAALASPLLMARWGHVGTYCWGALGAALFLLPMAFIPHWSAAGLGFAGVMGLTSLAVPAVNVYAMAVVPHRSRPGMSAAVELAVGLTFALTAFGGGYLIVGLGYPSLFLAASAASVVGTLLFWAYFRRPRGELARSQSPLAL